MSNPARTQADSPAAALAWMVVYAPCDDVTGVPRDAPNPLGGAAGAQEGGARTNGAR